MRGRGWGAGGASLCVGVRYLVKIYLPGDWRWPGSDRGNTASSVPPSAPGFRRDDKFFGRRCWVTGGVIYISDGRPCRRSIRSQRLERRATLLSGGVRARGCKPGAISEAVCGQEAPYNNTGCCFRYRHLGVVFRMWASLSCCFSVISLLIHWCWGRKYFERLVEYWAFAIRDVDGCAKILILGVTCPDYNDKIAYLYQILLVTMLRACRVSCRSVASWHIPLQALSGPFCLPSGLCIHWNKQSFFIRRPLVAQRNTETFSNGSVTHRSTICVCISRSNN